MHTLKGERIKCIKKKTLVQVLRCSTLGSLIKFRHIVASINKTQTMLPFAMTIQFIAVICV